MWGLQGAGRAEVMGDRWNWTELLPAVKLRMNQDAHRGLLLLTALRSCGGQGSSQKGTGPLSLSQSTQAPQFPFC